MKAKDFISNMGLKKAQEALNNIPKDATHLRLWDNGDITPLKGGQQNPRYWSDQRWWYANHWFPDCEVSDFKIALQIQ